MRVFFRGLYYVAIVLGLFMLPSSGPVFDHLSPQDIVAWVNGKPITRTEIERGALSLGVAREIGAIIADRDPGAVTDPEMIWEYLRREFSSAEGARYCRRVQWTTEHQSEPNGIFNRLVREEVQYQEAVRQGHGVTIKEAREFYRGIQPMGNEALGADHQAWERQLEEIAALKMGLDSVAAMEEARIHALIRTLPVSRLKEKLKGDWGRQHQDLRDEEFIALSDNRWEDYTDELLRRADVRIMDPGYRIIFYGEL